jgi:hypothetical protein
VHLHVYYYCLLVDNQHPIIIIILLIINYYYYFILGYQWTYKTTNILIVSKNQEFDVLSEIN